jgi:hypothetical protein
MNVPYDRTSWRIKLFGNVLKILICAHKASGNDNEQNYQPRLLTRKFPNGKGKAVPLQARGAQRVLGS